MGSSPLDDLITHGFHQSPTRSEQKGTGEDQEVMKAANFRRRVIEHLAQQLKPRGFSRKGSTFNLNCGDVIQMIEIQTSTSSTRDAVRLTVNLMVYSPSIAHSLGLVPKSVGPLDYHWR